MKYVISIYTIELPLAGFTILSLDYYCTLRHFIFIFPAIKQMKLMAINQSLNNVVMSISVRRNIYNMTYFGHYWREIDDDSMS